MINAGKIQSISTIYNKAVSSKPLGAIRRLRGDRQFEKRYPSDTALRFIANFAQPPPIILYNMPDSLAEVLNRFDRTLALLIRLQSKRKLRAQDLADQFGVSLRTIYRDIKSLEAAGVPIIGEAGTGYTLMEGYRLPPVMFTAQEALSFVAAEKLMDGFSDPSLRAYFQSALDKIKSVLKTQEKGWLAHLHAQISAEPVSRLFNPNVPNALEILFTALARQTQVLLHYRTPDTPAPQQRSIEPVGLFHENNQWYLYAYCHLRADYRQFRTDRIEQIQATERPFALKHSDLNDLRAAREPNDCPKTRVVLLVQKHVLRYIDYTQKYFGFQSAVEREEGMVLTFQTPSLEGLARWYLMFADQAQILEPDALVNLVADIMEKARRQLSAQPFALSSDGKVPDSDGK